MPNVTTCVLMHLYALGTLFMKHYNRIITITEMEQTYNLYKLLTKFLVVFGCIIEIEEQN